MDDYKEAAFSDHNRVGARVNSSRLWEHTHEILKLKPDKFQQWGGEVATRPRLLAEELLSIDDCWETEQTFSLRPWRVDHAPGQASLWRVFEGHKGAGRVLRQAGGGAVCGGGGAGLAGVSGWGLNRIKTFCMNLCLSTDVCFYFCTIRLFFHILEL